MTHTSTTTTMPRTVWLSGPCALLSEMTAMVTVGELEIAIVATTTAMTTASTVSPGMKGKRLRPKNTTAPTSVATTRICVPVMMARRPA